MHLPDKWGMLQFSTGAPGTAEVVYNEEWPVRSVAMILYYAQHSYQQAYGAYTDNITALLPFASEPEVLRGVCTTAPLIALSRNGSAFEAYVTDSGGTITASIRDDRLLLVQHSPSTTSSSSSSLSTENAIEIAIGVTTFVLGLFLFWYYKPLPPRGGTGAGAGAGGDGEWRESLLMGKSSELGNPIIQ